LGQTIPALLSIDSSGANVTAKLSSDMGNANLGTIELVDNTFSKATAVDMDGHSIPIEITASFDGESTEGTITMQNASLPFTGTKQVETRTQS
jgi:hypothetical protein